MATETRCSRTVALLNDNMRGTIYMTLAMGGFAVNDVVTKSFAGQLNIGQMVFLRGLFAVA